MKVSICLYTCHLQPAGNVSGNLVDRESGFCDVQLGVAKVRKGCDHVQ